MSSTNTGEPSASKQVTVVGFGPRLLAAIIDGVMVGFLGFTLAFFIGMIAIFLDMFRMEQSSGPLELITLLCVLGFSIVYYTGFWTADGQTIGKGVLGLKVVGTDGSQLSTGKALLRYIGYIVNAIVLSIGFVWAAFDHRRQGWHDKIAGTLVVYTDESFSAADKVEFIPSDYEERGWIWAVIWALSALFLPIGALAGLVAVGPFVTIALANLIRNIF